MVERECKPFQLAVCQLEPLAPLLYLRTTALLPLLGGVTANPAVLDAPRVPWSLLLMAVVAVRVRIKHRLLDSAACVTRIVTVPRESSGRRVLLRHVGVTPLPVLHFRRLAA